MLFLREGQLAFLSVEGLPALAQEELQHRLPDPLVRHSGIAFRRLLLDLAGDRPEIVPGPASDMVTPNSFSRTVS